MSTPMLGAKLDYFKLAELKLGQKIYALKKGILRLQVSYRSASNKLFLHRGKKKAATFFKKV